MNDESNVVSIAVPADVANVRCGRCKNDRFRIVLDLRGSGYFAGQVIPESHRFPVAEYVCAQCGGALYPSVRTAVIEG